MITSNGWQYFRNGRPSVWVSVVFDDEELARKEFLRCAVAVGCLPAGHLLQRPPTLVAVHEEKLQLRASWRITARVLWP